MAHSRSTGGLKRLEILAAAGFVCDVVLPSRLGARSFAVPSGRTVDRVDDRTVTILDLADDGVIQFEW